VASQLCVVESGSRTVGGNMWSQRRAARAGVAGAPAKSQALASEEALSSAAPEMAAAPSVSAETAGTGPEVRQAATSVPTDGLAVPPPTTALDEKAQQFWRGKLAAANFGGAVSLFMRSPAHRHYTMADLEWCLLPALALNQLMTAEARQPDGQAVPAAIVLWARVSPEIDTRLSAAPRYPIRLHPNEWRSGEVIWIVDAVGEPKAVEQCIDGLAKTAFQGNKFKMLSSKQESYSSTT
jgi:hemolysin-activating ACP:hemolysin acyltransferase